MLSEPYWRLRGFIAIESSDPAPARSIPIDLSFGLFKLATLPDFAVSTDAVLQLVAISTCSAYDCEFVALAKEQQVQLVTVDRQILRDFPTVTIPLQAFARE
jgi:hypothetical protein